MEGRRCGAARASTLLPTARSWRFTSSPELVCVHDEGLSSHSIGFVETPGGVVFVLGADPGFLAANGLAEREHLIEQSAGDALLPQGRCDADLVDEELCGFVRMPVHDRSHLSDYFVRVDRDDHVVAGVR